MSLAQGIASYHRNVGIRGVLAMSANRLTGRPREIATCPPGLPFPVHLRLRTTDAAAFADILRRGYYCVDLPFEPEFIVDAGANIGMASIYFANRYPKARILAVEAEFSNFEMLRKNVQYYPSITPIHTALWNRDGQISIEGAERAKTAFVAREGSGNRVRSITLSTLMSEFRVPRLDLLKMDIEGAEIEVFEDCSWISGLSCLMIELHDRFRPGCTPAVMSQMGGFTSFEREETTFFIRNGPGESKSS